MSAIRFKHFGRGWAPGPPDLRWTRSECPTLERSASGSRPPACSSRSLASSCSLTVASWPWGMSVRAHRQTCDPSLARIRTRCVSRRERVGRFAAALPLRCDAHHRSDKDLPLLLPEAQGQRHGVLPWRHSARALRLGNGRHHRRGLGVSKPLWRLFPDGTVSCAPAFPFGRAHARTRQPASHGCRLSRAHCLYAEDSYATCRSSALCSRCLWFAPSQTDSSPRAGCPYDTVSRVSAGAPAGRESASAPTAHPPSDRRGTMQQTANSETRHWL